MRVPFRLECGSGVVLVERCGSLEELEEIVSNSEWLASEKLTSEYRRIEWLSSRAIIRRELKAMGLSVDPDVAVVESEPGGAPIINPTIISTISVSISHTKGCVAVVLSANRCCVDIEHSERAVAHLLPRFASDTEIELLKKESVKPILLWCIKEALYKYAGREGGSFKDELTLKAVDYMDENSFVFKCFVVPDIDVTLTALTLDNSLCLLYKV